MPRFASATCCGSRALCLSSCSANRFRGALCPRAAGRSTTAVMSDDAALEQLAAHMNAAQRAALRAAMKPLDVEPGQVLFVDGEPLDALHVVVSGAIDLSITVHDAPVKLGHVPPN